MFDFIRATPGMSPTSPGSGTTTTVSVFGSGTNENQFLIDGTNFTCPCNGVARAEPGIDFIQEIQVQSMGASAESGNVQGGVINVIARQGGERLLYDASYYGQANGLTSQPVRLAIPNSNGDDSAYERDRYRDFTTSLGGPVVASGCGSLPAISTFATTTVNPARPGVSEDLRAGQGHGETHVETGPWLATGAEHPLRVLGNPDPPTAITPFAATLRRSASVPAMTFGHLTHTSSSHTVWEARVGRFVFSQDNTPSTGDLTAASRIDNVTNVAAERRRHSAR